MTTFSFIGHSNGTYLLGESLRAIPSMRFARVAVVGSVLPAEFDWEECAQRGQLESLRVDCSSHDWPVGWLCSLLRGAGMRDIGTGGFEGFLRLNGVQACEYLWHPGGHSAPLASTHLPALAAFAVVGELRPPETLRPEAGWFAFVSRALPRIAFLLPLGLLAGLGWLFVANWVAGLGALAALVGLIVILDLL